jgi:hypothetical protein
VVYTDTNVAADTAYAYRAQNLMSDGHNSDFQTGETVQSLPGLPAAPVLDAVQAQSANALHVRWTPAAGDVVDEFRVERAEAAGGPFSPIMTAGGEVTGALDSGLAPVETRYYRVVALNEGGESPPSDVLDGTTRSQLLAAPQNLQATLLEDGWIELSWDAGPAGATTEIEMLTFGLEAYVPLDATGAAGPYLYLPVEANAYDFRVKFVQGNDESPYAETDTSVVVQGNWHTFLPLITR